MKCSIFSRGEYGFKVSCLKISESVGKITDREFFYQKANFSNTILHTCQPISIYIQKNILKMDKHNIRGLWLYTTRVKTKQNQAPKGPLIQYD